jgi:hypothetical protein
MRPWPALLASAALLPALVVLQPSVAVAGPATELCAADGARGGVPETFALDACAAADSLTVLNDLDVPVLVRADGDIGAPSHIHQGGGSAASVLRLAAEPGTVLMPGDIVRWPLGAGAGGLTVSGLQPSAAPAIVDALDPLLPKPGADGVGIEDFRAFAVVARAMSTAVQERAQCVRGKNFLRVAACDVAASTTISRSAIAQLPNRSARQVLAVALDSARWVDWSAAAKDGLPARDPVALRLTQAPAPVPVVPTPPPPPPSVPVQRPSAPALAVPAPEPPPTPVPVPVPVPSRVPELGHGTIVDFLEEVVDRAAPDRDDDDRDDDRGDEDRGNGNGNGKEKKEKKEKGKGKGRDD